jgi:hypothetical protein
MVKPGMGPGSPRKERTMKQYLLSIYQPDGPPPPSIDLERIMRDVHALREEMKTAGAWVFAAGLHPASTATVVRVKDGESLMTDGPYTEGKEHLGGFCIVQAADLDAALEWGGKLARVLSPLPIEVRPLQEDH